MDRNRLFKQSILLAVTVGAVFTSYVSLTMFWEMSINLWQVINSLLFIATLLVAGLVGYRHRAANLSFGSMLLSVAVFYLVIMLMYVGGYAATTAYFADRMVWMPLFFRDYNYHGFKSVADYLDHKDNFRQLILLQFFSSSLASIFYLIAGCLGYVARGLIVRKATVTR